MTIERLPFVKAEIDRMKQTIALLKEENAVLRRKLLETKATADLLEWQQHYDANGDQA